MSCSFPLLLFYSIIEVRPLSYFCCPQAPTFSWSCSISSPLQQSFYPTFPLYWNQHRIQKTLSLSLSRSNDMSSLSHALLLTTTLVLMLFSAPVGVRSVNRSPISPPQAMLMEDKIRLGSTPPSCHNRCNTCNPCTAVQVPTLPARVARLRPSESDGGGDPSFNEYTNYKPLGWKCRCRDHLYDP